MGNVVLLKLKDNRFLRKFGVNYLCQRIIVEEKLYFANFTNRIQNGRNKIKIKHQLITEEYSVICTVNYYINIILKSTKLNK